MVATARAATTPVVIVGGGARGRGGGGGGTAHTSNHAIVSVQTGGSDEKLVSADFRRRHWRHGMIAELVVAAGV